MNNKDLLYAKQSQHIADFVFNEEVVGVFDDMINRSVPGYAAIVQMIGTLARRYVKDSSVCYDLGCSLGAATISIQRNICKRQVKIISVDNSKDMVNRCKKNLKNSSSDVSVEVICDDIQSINISQASLVVLNFTLQFIDPQKREDLIKSIYEGLLPGGILIISEKIIFEDKKQQELQTQLHHAFKKLNGYSDLEISQKRTALEKVLVSDTLNTHKKRLKNAGFKECNVWFQCFNFMSMVAFK